MPKRSKPRNYLLVNTTFKRAKRIEPLKPETHQTKTYEILNQILPYALLHILSVYSLQNKTSRS